MHKSARTVLCGGDQRMVVSTATVWLYRLEMLRRIGERLEEVTTATRKLSEQPVRTTDGH